MRRRDMKGFEKRLDSDLPVHPRNDFADVHRLVTVLEVPRLKMRRDVAKVLLEWPRVGIQVNEDEASPDPDLRLGQTEFLVLDVREVPAPWDKAKRAVQPPGEAVKLTAETRDMTAALAQNPPAMQTGIMEGLDLSRA